MTIRQGGGAGGVDGREHVLQTRAHPQRFSQGVVGNRFCKRVRTLDLRLAGPPSVGAARPIFNSLLSDVVTDFELNSN